MAVEAVGIAAFIAALKEKKALGNECPHRLWLIGGGGAFNGAYLAGVQVALVEAGLHLSLSGVIGVSTSIPALGYLLAARQGETERHIYETTTYSVEARSRLFVKWYGRTDAAWLRSVFEGVTGKPIRYDRVMSSGVRFVGVATEWDTGRPQYIEPTSRDEFFTLIEAGCSMPGLSPPVYLRGSPMTDSVTGDPSPVPWLMSLPESERPTHVLFVTNAWHEPPARARQVREWLLLRFIHSRTVPRHIIDRFALRHRRFYRGVATAIKRSDVEVAILWLPWRQRPLERNSRKITALTKAGYEHVCELISKSDTT